MREEILWTNVDQRVQWAIRLLCVLGLGVAGYLASNYLADTEPYCGGTHGCTEVQHSAYADVVGIPIPIIGIAGYLVLLVLSALRSIVGGELAFYLPVLSFGAALVGMLFSAYLTYLEAFVIRAWCYWCLASAVIMVIIWFLSVVDLRRAWLGE